MPHSPKDEKKEKLLSCSNCQHQFSVPRIEEENYEFCPKCGSKLIAAVSDKADPPFFVGLDEEGKNIIELSPPWGGHLNMCRQSAEGSPRIQSEFIKRRTDVHTAYIIEKEKTRRLYLIMAAVLLALSIAVFIFSPREKQSLSYWIGGSLLLLAAGAAGFNRVSAKSKIFDLSADQGKE
jgi:DNA-directed RNA polymerase subunit RPC12/RpoP